MWLEIIEGALLLGSFVYYRWMAPGPPAPLVAGIKVPIVTEGAPLPLVYGRCRVRSPILIWSGWPVVPHGGNGDYSIVMVFVVGVPFYGGGAVLNGIYAGDVRMPSGTIPFFLDPPGIGRRHIAANLITPTGFIGGGPNGAGEWWEGSPTQNVGGTGNGGPGLDDTMVGFYMSLEPSHPIPATDIPGYRNQIVALLGGGSSDGSSRVAPEPDPGDPWVFGRSPDVPNYGFDVTSLSTGFAADLGHSLPDDADPAAVLLDLITSPWAKLALPVSRIDMASFRAVSATLFAEGHGYSRAIEQPEDATTIIGDVLRQIDGVMYEEPTNGLIVLQLIRNDFGDPALLPNINPDNTEPPEPGWYSVQGWGETINQVRLTYTDRANGFADGVVIAQNGANATGQGGRIRNLDVKYVGCCTPELARAIASRELAVVSKPMVKATLKVNRSFYLTRPGDVVTLTWPDLGIDRMVMRVARVDLGQLHAGAITLNLIREVFDVDLGAFPVP